MDLTSGVKIAAVAEIKDPLGKGRVQIRFPAMASQTQEWARVVTSLSGATTIGPQLEVGDQVLLAFEGGDPTRPFVIGKLLRESLAVSSRKVTESVHLPNGSTLRPILVRCQEAREQG